jgi:hypothetical protein
MRKMAVYPLRKVVERTSNYYNSGKTEIKYNLSACRDIKV